MIRLNLKSYWQLRKQIKHQRNKLVWLNNDLVRMEARKLALADEGNTFEAAEMGPKISRKKRDILVAQADLEILESQREPVMSFEAFG